MHALHNPRTPSEKGTYEPGTLLLRGSIRVSLRRDRTLPAHNNAQQSTRSSALSAQRSLQATTAQRQS
jgi:hypothetical protein